MRNVISKSILALPIIFGAAMKNAIAEERQATISFKLAADVSYESIAVLDSLCRTDMGKQDILSDYCSRKEVLFKTWSTDNRGCSEDWAQGRKQNSEAWQDQRAKNSDQWQKELIGYDVYKENDDGFYKSYESKDTALYNAFTACENEHYQAYEQGLNQVVRESIGSGHTLTFSK